MPGQGKQPKNAAQPEKKTVQSAFNSSQRGGGVLCDTLQNFQATDTLVLFDDPDGGYVSGQNSYGDIAKAEIYTGIGSGGTVGSVLILFGAASAANATDTFTVNIWDGSGGSPGNILASTNYTYQMAEDDVSSLSISVVNFPGPANVGSTFFAGVAFDYAAGDTIAIVNSNDLSVVPATAWELFADGVTWVPYDDADSWGLTVSNVIIPVVCGTTGFSNVAFDNKFAVYPTIASDRLNLLMAPAEDNVTIRLTDLSGGIVLSASYNTRSNHTGTIDVSQLASGTYFVSMSAGKHISTKKIIIQR